jgi:L-2,4-diaminobutyrate decarboxylase
MPSLAAAFDPQLFRALAHRTVDQLAEYLEQAMHGGNLKVLPYQPPEELLAKWSGDFPKRAEITQFPDLLRRVLDDSNHLHHPHYVGHQVTAPLPLAAITDMVAGLLNNGMAVYEMGMAATAMERRLLQWMSGLLGFPATADGILTHGGSVGNLTALLTARQAKAGFDVWDDGAHAGSPLALLTSDQAHYSVQRAVQVMGWGAGGVIAVPSDARYRMRANALADGLRRAQHAGRTVIAVVASAGSTATGAYDPLEAIADFCAANDLWLHVDGAHGASVALCERYRSLLAGIERADSVVWDAHKMLLMPALITAVLFREGHRSYEAFAQQASYLFAGSDDLPPWWDVGARTLECTKRMLSIKLYAALQSYGTDMFAQYVESRSELAKRFAELLRAADDFQLAVEPECNIVCFRYTPRGAQELDAMQTRIRQHIIASGSFYLVQTRLRDGVYLRTTLINPFTTETDLMQLLDAVRSADQQSK